MSLDLFPQTVAASDQYVAANAAPEVPAGFSEALDVSWRSMTEWQSSTAYENARDLALANYYDDVKRRTGEQLPLYGMGGNVSLDDLNAGIAKLREQRPDDGFMPLTEADIDTMARRRMAAAHDAAARFAARETTWGGTAGTVLGTLAGGLTDPVTLATLPLGGAGTAGIALRGLEFAAIAGGTQAATSALNASAKEAAVPGSWREIPGEIATATVVGGVFGLGFGALQKLAGLGAKPLPTSAREEINAAASEAQRQAVNPFPTASGEAAARDAETAAVKSALAGERVTAGESFEAAHVADYAAAAKADTPEALALAGEQHLRPETYREVPDVERFDPMPTAADDAASYWERRLAEASAEERAAMGATDAGAAEFDLTREFWHGTTQGKFTEFRDSVQNNDVLGPAVYLSASKSGAEFYGPGRGGDLLGPFHVRGNIVTADTMVPLNADGSGPLAPAGMLLGKLKLGLTDARMREPWGRDMSGAEYAREFWKRRGVDGYSASNGAEVAIYDPKNIRAGFRIEPPSHVGEPLPGRGLKLVEAPEGGAYAPEDIRTARGERYFKVVDSEGNVAAEVLMRIDGSTARIQDILIPDLPMESGRNAIGPAELRGVLRQFQEVHPEITKLTGKRVSGARMGGAYDFGDGAGEVSVNLPRIAPREMKAEEVAKLADEPQVADAVQRNLDRIRVERPDAEYTTQIKQPDGSYQLVSRKLEDVLDEIDAEEALGQELMACATGMMAAE
ncbi:hypothetical protein LOC51_19855 [Rubrivivax sp. JA1024]|nr:hypothetical protein [Rubrivivax sp. JA1024]